MSEINFDLFDLVLFYLAANCLWTSNQGTNGLKFSPRNEVGLRKKDKCDIFC